MIDVHYWPTPNGWKISIMLEETGLPYRMIPVDIGRGQQFEPEFLAISPNNRIPAIIDTEPAQGAAPISIFESGAILLYLAEKSKQLLPMDLTARYRAIQWVMWQVGGLGPMAGQNGHFLLYAQEKIPYAIERYGNEVRRLYGVLDRALGDAECVAGDYSVADIAIFPWVMTHKAQGLTLDDYPNAKRWFATVRARPAVQAGLAVGVELRKEKMSDEARQHLFGKQAGSTPQ